MPQLSVGIALPSVDSITAADGLQPRFTDVFAIGISGAMVSVVQVVVLLTIVVLPELSMAVHVRIFPNRQPVLKVLSDSAYDRTPQLSEAVEDPRAVSIVAALGLHPRSTDVSFVLMTGAIRSTVHVAVLLTMVVLLQLSIAV